MKQYTLQNFLASANAILKENSFSLPKHHLRVYFELADLNDSRLQVAFSITYLTPNLRPTSNMISVYASSPESALDKFRIVIKERSNQYPNSDSIDLIV